MAERDPRKPRETPADPARFLAHLGRQLAAEESALGYASDEEIEAYVDGTGDPTERLLFEERLARDSALAAMVRDLIELRAALEAEAEPAATLLPFRRPEIHRRLVWAAAAAAALFLFVVVPVGHEPQPAPTAARVVVPGGTVPAPAAVQPQKLFSDGFEAGDPAGWSAVASGG